MSRDPEVTNESRQLKKKIPVVIQKLFTIDQSFQKIRLERTAFRVVGKFPGATEHLKGGPVFADRLFQFRTFEAVFRSVKLVYTNGKRDSETKFTSPVHAICPNREPTGLPM